jgi:transposase-like protein
MKGKKSLKPSNQRVSLLPRRVFSEELRRKIVRDIGAKLHTVSEITRLYGVSSTAVYCWIHRYTPGLVPGTTQVVQMESEAERTRQAEARVAELERALGRKQLEKEYLERLIEVASESLCIDLKKTFGTTPSSGSASTETNTGTR